jgi:hypothetical protein
MSMPYADACTCRHSPYCNHECHGRHCDPSEHICSLEFLPDEGGLTPWGCADCTPGEGLPHAGGCPSVAAAGRSLGGDAPSQPSAPFS